MGRIKKNRQTGTPTLTSRSIQYVDYIGGMKTRQHDDNDILFILVFKEKNGFRGKNMPAYGQSYEGLTCYSTIYGVRICQYYNKQL